MSVTLESNVTDNFSNLTDIFQNVIDIHVYHNISIWSLRCDHQITTSPVSQCAKDIKIEKRGLFCPNNPKVYSKREMYTI